MYFFQATWTILRKSSPGSSRSSRVRRSGTWTRTPWRCWSTSRTTSWSSSSTATRRSRRSLSPRSTPSTMRPRSWRSSWSRTETLRLQGRNRTVSYHRKFLCRNYGIFVLPAVVHFEDGVPNIYEGQKDFVFAWLFTESPLVSSNPKIHIHTMVDFCSLRVFLHFSTFIVSCYRSSVPCGRLQLAGGAEDNVCYWGGWGPLFN